MSETGHAEQTQACIKQRVYRSYSLEETGCELLVSTCVRGAVILRSLERGSGVQSPPLTGSPPPPPLPLLSLLIAVSSVAVTVLSFASFPLTVNGGVGTSDEAYPRQKFVNSFDTLA